MQPNDLILKVVADNRVLFEALKEKILEKFHANDLQHENTEDKLLGQIFRARLEGSRKVEEAFKEILRLRTPEKRAETVNKAR